MKTLACCIALISALVATDSRAADTVNVEITKFAFAPKELTVKPGTRVHWTNRDEAPHTVTSVAPSKVLASKALDTEDSFDFVFTTEGDFAYLCTVHPFMTAIVHVHK
ncbi:cupredoxin family copper-binding protein [soil metagenome]